MGESLFPWGAGTATGIGSMPGTDPAEAMRVVAGELPGFPHLPELPARGPGADMTGRAVALLVDMPAEVTPRGWRLAERPGRDLARARSMLAADLDVMEEVLQGYEGPVKVQVCGPWTLAATVELTRTMDAALSDAGAVADLTASLAEGIAAHLKDIERRLGRPHVVVQIDEPALSAVADGRVPTASGISRLPAIETDTVVDRLSQVITTAERYSIVHCCDNHVRFSEIARAGAGAVCFDLGQLRRGDEDAIAGLAEAGMGLMIGVTGVGGGPMRAKQAAERVLRLWQRTGVPARAEQTVITPACGLADTTPEQARAILTLCRDAAAILPELIEETGS